LRPPRLGRAEGANVKGACVEGTLALFFFIPGDAISAAALELANNRIPAAELGTHACGDPVGTFVGPGGTSVAQMVGLLTAIALGMLVAAAAVGPARRNEVPESSYGVVHKGQDELHPFRPSLP
jgi:hypothetical protein